MLPRSTKALRRRLDAAAPDFAAHALVHEVTRDGLFARLEPMTIRAREVVDLGAATGLSSQRLKTRFPGARVHAVDVSLAMLAQHPAGWLRKPSLVQADATALPFADGSIDVVFANLLLPFVDAVDRVCAEVSRVLTDGGLFVFSSLGPDSFGALRRAWHGIDDAAHVAGFDDMHETGDQLVAAGLRDPVLDVDYLTVSYRGPDTLFADLTATGARNSLLGRSRGLMGRRRWQTLIDRLFAADGPLEIELELVYGHAFGGAPMQARGPIAIDPASIGRRRRTGP